MFITVTLYLIPYQKILNERRRKRALRNDILNEEIFQNDLTEELTIKNSNIVINLEATVNWVLVLAPKNQESNWFIRYSCCLSLCPSFTKL